jgi:hypothetical protein
MAQHETGPIYEAIGRLISNALDGDAEGAFMYAEAGDNWQEASIFKDIGSKILYRDPSDELFDRIDEAWLAEEPGKRWHGMEFSISGGKFDATFAYPDELDLDNESSFERRARVLRKKYGDKPIDYSDP